MQEKTGSVEYFKVYTAENVLKFLHLTLTAIENWAIDQADPMWYWTQKQV